MNGLTLNTHAWMEDNPKEKLAAMADFISQENYDVIALQEINQSVDAEEAEDDTFIPPSGETAPVPVKEDNFALLLVHLLRERGHSYFWSWTATHIGYGKYDEGVAILMKTRFSSESILVSKSVDYTSSYTRRVLKAKGTIHNKNWMVFSCHYSWWTDEKGEKLFEYEWNQTLPHIKKGQDDLLILGDFNNEASIKSEGYDLVRQTVPFLNDAYTAADNRIGSATVVSDIDGWEGKTGEKRIDYIWTTQPKETAEYRVVFDGVNGPIVSDHFGVAVKIKGSNEETY